MMGQTKGRLDEKDLYMDVWDFAFLLHACMGHSVLILLYLLLGQLDLLEVILEVARCARHLSLARPLEIKKYFSPLHASIQDISGPELWRLLSFCFYNSTWLYP